MNNASNKMNVTANNNSIGKEMKTMENNNENKEMTNKEKLEYLFYSAVDVLEPTEDLKNYNSIIQKNITTDEVDEIDLEELFDNAPYAKLSRYNVKEIQEELFATIFTISDFLGDNKEGNDIKDEECEDHYNECHCDTCDENCEECEEWEGEYNTYKVFIDVTKNIDYFLNGAISCFRDVIFMTERFMKKEDIDEEILKQILTDARSCFAVAYKKIEAANYEIETF